MLVEGCVGRRENEGGIRVRRYVIVVLVLSISKSCIVCAGGVPARSPKNRGASPFLVVHSGARHTNTGLLVVCGRRALGLNLDRSNVAGLNNFKVRERETAAARSVGRSRVSNEAEADQQKPRPLRHASAPQARAPKHC